MKVVIVGGVAGGASAAARIRRLDESAEIIVFEKKDDKGFFIELLLFYSSRLLTGLLEIGAMALFVDLLFFNQWVVKIIANIVIIILNYIFSKFIIFKKDKTR